jgi:Leucine-rich repeat (LRR) protein
MPHTLKILISFTLALVTLFLLISPASAARNQVVAFPDVELEAQIRSALDKPVGDIYQSDLKKITTLKAYGIFPLVSEIIYSLSGLEYCTNLRELVIHQYLVTDISPLASLKHLRALSLPENSLDGDISALAGLTRLVKLDLSCTGLTDISLLTNFRHLNRLYLIDNHISDISPLVANPGIGRGDVVDLSLNDLDLTENSDDIINLETLRSRGVTIILDSAVL